MSTSAVNEQPGAFRNASPRIKQGISSAAVTGSWQKKCVVVFIKLCFRIFCTFPLTKGFHLSFGGVASDRIYFHKMQRWVSFAIFSLYNIQAVISYNKHFSYYWLQHAQKWSRFTLLYFAVFPKLFLTLCHSVFTLAFVG